MMSYKSYSVEDFLADELFQKYCNGSDENANVYWNKILREEPGILPVFNQAFELYKLLNADQGNLTEQTTRLFNRIQADNQKAKPKGKLSSIKTWLAAAAVLLIVASGSYLFFNKPVEKIVKNEKPSIPYTTDDVAPGTDKAILTLADGSAIILDSNAHGEITSQGNVTIINLNGQLAYNQEGQSRKQVFYNTISTPRGGQYQLLLSDGTKVWLNAASSLKFPTSFEGNERRVELNGEGYFEVAHNPAKPFHVNSNEIDVQVLGTHFNIMAYADEAFVKTTLLEGSVKIIKAGESLVIAPGSQAVVRNNSDVISFNKNVDVEQVMAWKNGYFHFDNITIPEIMRQISRWYNVEVIYDGSVPKGHYVGRPSRNLNLSQLLKVIEYSGVELNIEGNKVIVSE